MSVAQPRTEQTLAQGAALTEDGGKSWADQDVETEPKVIVQLWPKILK